MAYSFFTNNTAHKSSRTPLSPTYMSNCSNNSNKLSIHPTPPRPPPPSNARRDTANSESQPPPPYPDALLSQPTPHPQISVDPVNTAHIPSLTRITGVLLPIRYPNGFYTATITDPIIASLSRVAIYHDDSPAVTDRTKNQDLSTDKVIGAIRCRLEPLPQDTAPSSGVDQPVRRSNLYIQTLLLLSPYRGNGVATSLLNSLLFEPSSSSADTTSTSDKPPTTRSISPLVRHYGIRTVTAHVHETNEDALHWYVARGFKVEDGVVEGYYRRLKPGGARVVRLTLPWEDEENAPDAEHNNDDDDDWEKIEASEVNDSPVRKVGKGGMKRKADDEIDR